MRPSYRARWLQFLLILMLVTTQRCNAQSASEKRWEKADLIVEGRITETTTENGIQISKLAVDRILKTETLASEPYSKGYVENLILHVPANTLAQHQTLRFFIEENQGTYRLLAAEKVENPVQTPYMNSGSYGFILLIVIALVASQRPLILPENKE
jgi:hypothetical protein